MPGKFEIGNGSRRLTWKCRRRTLKLGLRPLIMGIVNVTPDSFSDGGCFFDGKQAVGHGLELVREGADIIDVGGESTRPGARPVPAREECRRVTPVIRQLRQQTQVLISVDTTKSRVAAEALRAGADIINDVSALSADPDMAAVAAESGAGVILMHMRGKPRTMQNHPRYKDVVGEVCAYLEGRIRELTRTGLDRETLAIDPGIGFGKTTAHNISLLARLGELRRCGRPIVVGVSRKRCLGRLTGRAVGERLAGSLAAIAFCLGEGADIVRVHEVRETRDAVLVINALLQEKRRHV